MIRAVMWRCVSKIFKLPDAEILNLLVDSKKQITIDIADFIIDQAEKALERTLFIEDKTTDRTYGLLAIIIPLVSASNGFLLNEIDKSATLRIRLILFFCLVVLISLSLLFIMLVIILPRDTMQNGREPKAILQPNMLQTEDEHKRLLFMKINELSNLQYKISYNHIQNKIRISLFNWAIIITSASLFLGTIIYFIFV
jgi:hypothetical protein